MSRSRARDAVVSPKCLCVFFVRAVVMAEYALMQICELQFVDFHISAICRQSTAPMDSGN